MPTMQGAHNPASPSWHLRRLASDEATRAWVGEFSETPAGETTRWLRSKRGMTADKLVGEDGDSEVHFNLPATLRAIVDVNEGGWRTSRHEITITLVIEGDGPYRAVVDSLRIKRVGETGVTAAALRGFRLSEFVHFMLTHPPCCDKRDAETFQELDLPAESSTVSRVLSPTRRSGRRDATIVDLVKLAKVVRSAPPRELQKTLIETFPDIGLRTLMRAKAKAMSEGLLDD